MNTDGSEADPRSLIDPYTPNPGLDPEAIDTILSALSDGRRRRIVRALSRRQGAIHMKEIVGWFEGDSRGDTGSESPVNRDQVRAALYHNHLPALDSARILQFDPDEHTVTTGDNDRITLCLDILDQLPE